MDLAPSSLAPSRTVRRLPWPGGGSVASGERTDLDRARLARVKAAYTTRFAARLLGGGQRYGLLAGEGVCPMPGDIVLARVETIGQHARIELPEGRRAPVFPGDEILLAYGHRYAPDQFEAEVPGDLGPAHLVAAGGVAARVVTAHAQMSMPTQIHPLGLLIDSESVISLRRCAPLSVAPHAPSHRRGPATLAVVGTSMNSGKTTAAAAMVRGLTRAGLRVAAGKVTGTGAGGDAWLFVDSGACRVLDFTDFGYASTYRLPHTEIRALLGSMLAELGGSRPDAIVIEVADGVFQRETAALIADPLFAHSDGVVFAAGDALGAVAGYGHLVGRGLAVAAVGGTFTASPLAMREAAASLPVPVLTTSDLCDPLTATGLLPLRTATTSANGCAGDLVVAN